MAKEAIAEKAVQKAQQELTLMLNNKNLTPLSVQTNPIAVPDFSLSAYVQGLGVLFLLLGLLWFMVRLLKKYSRFSFIPRPGDLPKDALRMEAQMPIGPRKGLMVVRFLDTRLLLGVTDQQITVLSREQIRDGAEEQFAKLMEHHTGQDT